MENYKDLGLPSGTLWAETNEGGFFTYDEAVEKYRDNLPTEEQWCELKNKCTWQWEGNGYTVKGPNGNSIFLLAAGFRDCDGSIFNVGGRGEYWSSTANDSEEAMNLFFHSGGVGFLYSSSSCFGESVRLVKKKECKTDKQMKEDYKKKYEEALNRAKDWYDNPNSSSIGKSYLMVVFPELGESEDEKIRKVLIDLVKCNERSVYKSLNNISASSMLAWLEKQGEQKPAWSEEDERLCQCLIEDQEKALDKVNNSKVGHSEIISDLKEMYRERIGWLKSLKQRMKGETNGITTMQA